MTGDGAEATLSDHSGADENAAREIAALWKEVKATEAGAEKATSKKNAGEVAHTAQERQQRRSRPQKLADLHAQVTLFSKLPDDALISKEVFAALLGAMSIATLDRLRRRMKDDPNFPKARGPSLRRIGFRVGEVRAHLASRPEKPAG
jgi:hypothetical protein